MRAAVAVPLAGFSSYGWAQQLAAISPPSDSSGLIVAAVLAIFAGLAFLRLKRPDIWDKLADRAFWPKVTHASPARVEPAVAPATPIPTVTITPVLHTAAENDLRRQVDELRAQIAAIAPHVLVPEPPPPEPMFTPEQVQVATKMLAEALAASYKS